MHGIWNFINKYKSVVALSLAGLLLLMAQSAFWINQTIFDQRTFTAIVTSTLETEDSRQAISETVVNRALADKPILQRTIGSKATQLIAGLLGSDLSQQTFTTLVNKVYAYLTSNNPQPIAIDLLAIKTPIAGLISFAETLGRDVKFDPSIIPDSIVLFDSSSLPDIYKYSRIMLLLGPILWLSTIVIFATYIWRGRRVYAKRVYIVGGIIIFVSLIGLIVGPTVSPTIAAQVQVIELRGIVEDLVRNLLQPFTRQMLVTLGLTLALLLAFNQRFNIINLLQRLASKISMPKIKQAEVKTKPKTKAKPKKKK